MRPRETALSAKYGPWAVVTGASDGIGRASAVHLAAQGFHLILVARRHGVLEALADQLRQDYHIETQIVDADLSDPLSIERIITVADAKSVGLLVAAAGFGTSGPFIDLDIARELSMIDVNCRAAVAMTHRFAARFAAQRRGGVVLFSSLVAFQGVPRASTYAATKAFIQTFAEGLRRELASAGVDVIASAPGPVFSQFLATANMRSGIGVTPDTVAKRTLAALGRKGTVRPGFISKFLETSLSVLPRWGRVRMMEVVMGGMTRHQLEKPEPLAAKPSSSAP
jgi:short-subunit dehydrogenase